MEVRLHDSGDGASIGAAMQTPPYLLASNAIPVDAMDAVATQLTEWRPGLTGVRGTRSSAIAFADAWRRTAGRAGIITTEERLYRLGMLHAPKGVRGMSRLATDDDRAQVVEWVGLFFDEAFSQVHNDGGKEFVDTANRGGHRFVLWDVDGAPVSMAMLRVPAGGVSRVGSVFTPRDRRGHGYGSAVTAAAAVVDSVRIDFVTVD